MIATYDLSNYLASFEFFYWLVQVQADGATKICLDPTDPKLKNFTPEDVEQRFETIIRPGPALAGLESYVGNTKTQLRATPSQLVNWYRSGRRFRRLKTVLPPVACRYTVTIRQNRAGAKSRNSNREVWRQFAREIDAVVIDDYYNCPISLHDRMALYAGAEMNFGVCNGPMAALSLTKYPVAMVVNTQSARNSLTRHGSRPDENYPWMLPNQHLVWKSDDKLENLMEIFNRIVP